MKLEQSTWNIRAPQELVKHLGVRPLIAVSCQPFRKSIHSAKAEAFVEHDGAKVLIGEIEASDPDDEFYDAKMNVLSEEIKHHVKEEAKRDGMFAQARKAGIDMKAPGLRLIEENKRLTEEYKQNGLPTPPTTTSHATSPS